MRRRLLVTAPRRAQLFAALFLACALAGCASSAEQKAADQKAADQKTCEGQGYKPGSDGFAKCMMTIAQNRDKEREQDMNAVQMQQEIMMAPNCPTGMCW